MLTLVLSGSSSASIGAAVWKENPTVQSLIKMIVSNRYRYPTVDCDEATRDEMKKSEQAARDTVRDFVGPYCITRRHIVHLTNLYPASLKF